MYDGKDDKHLGINILCKKYISKMSKINKSYSRIVLFTIYKTELIWIMICNKDTNIQALIGSNS